MSFAYAGQSIYPVVMETATGQVWWTRLHYIIPEIRFAVPVQHRLTLTAIPLTFAPEPRQYIVYKLVGRHWKLKVAHYREQIGYYL